VTGRGELAPAAEHATADVTVRITPGLALRLATRDEAAWKEIEVAGDTEFAQAVNYVARNLQWDLEEDLSRLFGDVAAHRMAEAGRTLSRWGSQSAENVGRSLAEYWTEEDPLIAGAREVEEFNRAVDALRDDVARLEKRLDHLSRQDGMKN
jgi:ubiquinone biosynthesis protein UbiJ